MVGHKLGIAGGGGEDPTELCVPSLLSHGRMKHRKAGRGTACLWSGCFALLSLPGICTGAVVESCMGSRSWQHEASLAQEPWATSAEIPLLNKVA